MKGRLLLVVFLVTVLVSTLTTAGLIPVRTNENNTKVQKMNKTEREEERSVTPVERNITSRVGQVERKNKTTQGNISDKRGFSLPSLPSISYLPEALLFIFGGVAGWVGHALKIKREESKSEEEIEL